MTREIRLAAFEMRASDKSKTMIGYASVFGSWSEPIGGKGGFIERFLPGAFTEALRISDIRALVNHDPSKVLGRTASGTMHVREDDFGLLVTINSPDTTLANDLLKLIARGDVSQMSLAFTIADGGDTWNADFSERTIHRVDRLFDVSVVTFPAYEETSIDARSRAAAGPPENKVPVAIKRIPITSRFVRQQARHRQHLTG